SSRQCPSPPYGNMNWKTLNELRDELPNEPISTGNRTKNQRLTPPETNPLEAEEWRRCRRRRTSPRVPQLPDTENDADTSFWICCGFFRGEVPCTRAGSAQWRGSAGKSPGPRTRTALRNRRGFRGLRLLPYS